ncbi:glutamyl-tRNA(Gln) amidotransferase subunit B, mitochondrial [Onthophagus taurus]|uniref:glutamyl-tRNA(Gln) amidotransferase subunit B, mitochondrial n=1 Tax=Onthophagus taurus TaxID=166361 RepID=UPI0039BE2934
MKKSLHNIHNLLKKNYSTDLKWKSVVGLEVHAQISSESKLFSGASNEFASAVNKNVSLFDCSIPGTLPVLNKRCVEAGVLTGIALNCKINPVSYFDRKHYFYADLPTGYQITQQRAPLANDGYIEFHVYTPGVNKKPYETKARIKQLQLEQDSGKSLHEDTKSLVDLNRAGCPLMEVVFEPDLKDGEEAASLVKELITILQRIDTCSCKMEEGALRVDANVSVHLPGEPYGVRTEIKNIGSIRGVAGAVKYEINRQIKILQDGGKIINETRAWDANSKSTVAMRDKEQQQDYRYMPEPNLPPLHIALGPVEQGCVNVDKLKESIPELPQQTRERLQETFGLTLEQSVILVNESKLLYIFESVLDQSISPKLLTNLLLNDLLTIINKEKLSLDEISISLSHLKEIVVLLSNGEINRNTCKLLLERVVQGDSDSPRNIVEKEGWSQINDLEEIKVICKRILDENPKMVKQYHDGKAKVFKAFLGIADLKSNHRVNMSVVNNVMKELLKK